MIEEHPATDLDRRIRHVIDRFPAFKSGYAKQRVWVDEDQLRIRKVDYYDRRDALLKTLTMSGFKLYNGRFWRAGRFDMKNQLTGKSTALMWSSYRFGVGLAPSELSVNALNRLN